MTMMLSTYGCQAIVADDYLVSGVEVMCLQPGCLGAPDTVDDDGALVPITRKDSGALLAPRPA